jgi:hypothetical protein
LAAIRLASVERCALNRLGAKCHFEAPDECDSERRAHDENEIASRAVADREMEGDSFRFGIDEELLE